MDVYDCVDELMRQRNLLFATVQMAYPYFHKVAIKTYAGGYLHTPADCKEVAVDGLEDNDIGYCHLRIDLWNYGLYGVYYVWLQCNEDGFIEHSLSSGIHCNFHELLDLEFRWAIENWLGGVLSRLRSVARCGRIKEELVEKNWKCAEVS